LQIKKINPDIIHFHTPAFAGLEAILTAKVLKKPLIGTFHTYFMSPEYQKIVGLGKVGGEFIEKVLWKYNNSIYNRCDLVITPSEFAKRDLIKNGLKKPIKIIHNSVNPDSLTKASREKVLKLKKKLKLGNKTILYVGRISREKSLNILILAFNLVIRSKPSAKLLLIGDGPARDELKELTMALGLEKNIIFTGKIAHGELLKSGVFESVNLFVTSSTSEVQPMSVLEAMAFGLPIVGVKARGMLELIRGNGLICRPGDIKQISEAIVKIFNNESLRKKFSQKSKKLIEKEYAVNKATGRLEEIYKKLVNKKLANF